MNNWCICFSRIFLLGILMFKGHTARRLYKSFGVKFLMFCGPSIVTHLYNKQQQDAPFTISFTPVKNLYTFRSGLLLIRSDAVYPAICTCHVFMGTRGGAVG
jgi:hypothetical protein